MAIGDRVNHHHYFEMLAWDKVAELNKEVESLMEDIRLYKTVLEVYAKQILELQEKLSAKQS